MAILVTGGSGFIGSNFILEWLSKKQELVINLDSLTYAANQKNLEPVWSHIFYKFIHGDINDPKIVGDIFRRFSPRAVIHFAAESHVDNSIRDPGVFVDTNIKGTFNLLNESLHYWDSLFSDEKDNFRFIHISTDEVYGALGPEDPPFIEDSPYAPNSPYSASKAASDHLVRSYFKTYGLPTIITHSSNNFGPFQFPEKLIPLCVKNAMDGKVLPIYGDGKQIRDWIFVRDHCKAIEKVLELGAPGETYNIGGENEITNEKIVFSICAVLDDRVTLPNCDTYINLIEYVHDRPGHDFRYAINCDKMKGLGWKPEADFYWEIQNTVAWFLANALNRLQR